MKKIREQKTPVNIPGRDSRVFKKLVLMTKITVFCFFLSIVQVMAVDTYAQMTRISIKADQERLENVLGKIESESEFFFLYNKDLVDVEQKVSVDAQNETIKAILDQVFEGKDIAYTVFNRQIVLSNIDMINEMVAQQKSVSGTVTDQSGQPLPGVTVVVKGTTQGTVTNADGNYSLINIPGNATLVFSFVGMLTQEVVVGDQTNINIEMAVDAIGIEEVVAIGYGTQKKVNLTGSVGFVDAEQIVSKSVGQASMALQGLIPGVTVIQNSGKPGADGGTIRIRGVGTIGDSNPLILVDGVPGSMNDLDVSEIDNISVLKDAASASIYGSRAANGVILITTKRAKDNQFQINYRASAGWQEPTGLMQKVNGYDHMVMINEAYNNVGRTPPFSQEYVDAYKTNAPSDEYPETNWHNVMLKDRAFQQNHYIGVNGGGEKIKILGSVSYWDQDGILESNYERLNIRLNSDIQIRKNLSIGFDILVKNEGNSEPPQQWYWLARYPQNLAGKNENGSWGIGWDGSNGWATQEDGGHAESITNETLVNMKADWEVTKGLNFRLQIAPNKSINHYKSFRKHVDLYYPDGTIVNPSEFKATLTEKFTKPVTNNYKFLIDYNKNIQDHTISALLGWEAIDYKTEWIQGYREQFPLENYEVLNVGSQLNQEATGSAAEWSLMSYFGRINYNFKEKYLLEANVRVDGSSRFAKNYRYGVFPSFSAGWRISEEPFLEDANWLPYMKLRASWGNLGNQNIGNYPYTSSVTFGQNYIFGDAPFIGAALVDGANPEISWEKTEIVNFGLDANIGNFNLTADYYIKNTSDILLELPIPLIAGLSAPYQNAGKVRNRGWDLRLEYSNQIKKLNYRIGATLADVKNEVVDLVGTGPYIYTRNVHMEGYPIYSLFGLEAEGLFLDENDVLNHASQFGAVQPGDIKYKDQSVDVDGDGIPDEPDGVVNASDRVVLGSTIPRYNYSFDFSFNYEGFDLELFFQGVGKVDGYLDNFATMAFYLGGSAMEWQKDHWTVDNPNAPYPRLTFNYPNNEQVSSYWMRSAAYLRLKNLQFGYTLPARWMERISVKKLRVFFSGQNLFTLDDFYQGYDPEAPVGQGDYYPMVKVFSFGIETNF